MSLIIFEPLARRSSSNNRTCGSNPTSEVVAQNEADFQMRQAQTSTTAGNVAYPRRLAQGPDLKLQNNEFTYNEMIIVIYVSNFTQRCTR